MENNHRFFKNLNCKYFPCHTGISEENFNCLFCYCPLYMLQEDCGGNYKYHKGVKSCINCNLPHIPQGYELINKKLGAYIKIQKTKREGDYGKNQ
ncbi:MAG: cysteine-rich small domain-containing protein [Tissierellia bacterium]|nr:cysteine-rich small domain-containing protein [Tissierellia bacterium]